MINSYIFYVLTILLSTFFAYLAQKFRIANKKNKVKPNRLFWMISMGILIFVMGFRDYTIGVDGANYIRVYDEINSVNLLTYYAIKTTEPGYYLLNRIVKIIFDDYQAVFVISAIITIACFYKAISYEIENISLGFAVFIFAATQYFYYFGIMRMGIAASIVAIAYRYILENNKKKYIGMILLATSFHYSALFALFALFINSNTNLKFERKTLFKLVVLIPIAFIGMRVFIYPLLGSRYSQYVESSSMGISIGMLSVIPLLILFSIYYSQLENKGRNAQFYYLLFIVKVMVEIFSPIVGIGRMVWYTNISICYLFPYVTKMTKDRILKLILLLLIVFYSLFYCWYAYFGESERGETMLPYKNVYFEYSIDD